MIAQDIARLIVDVQFPRLPSQVVRGVKSGIIDCLGVMLAGTGEDAPRIVASQLRTSAGPDAAPAFPSKRLLRREQAALVNGVSAHVLDYDDVAINGHPSAVLVPCLLAESWNTRVTAGEFIAAYVCGYEVWARLASAMPEHLHDKGFHPTAIFGTIAAAAASSRLLGLSSSQCAHAVSIAASQAAGLVGNFGSMVKAYHVGRAAEAGLIATRLAQAGLMANLDVFEHHSGFFRSFYQVEPPATDRLEWGLDHYCFEQYGLNLKRYPTCYGGHRAIDAALSLVEQHDIDPAAVESAHVMTGTTQMIMLKNHLPTNALEAKFSLEFAIASAIAARAVGLRQLDDNWVRNPNVRRLMTKVTYSTTAETDGVLPFAPDERVEIVVGGARFQSDAVKYARGSWENPMTDSDLRQKFDDCLVQSGMDIDAGTLFERLSQLDHASSAAKPWSWFLSPLDSA